MPNDAKLWPVSAFLNRALRLPFAGVFFHALLESQCAVFTRTRVLTCKFRELADVGTAMQALTMLMRMLMDVARDSSLATGSE